ncbi:MAG: outer membrane protein transport protein [Pseudomonadota bacterium]
MMHRIALLATSAVLLSGDAIAGGLDRSRQDIDALFEPGNYVEFSFATVSPSVSGTQLPNPLTPDALDGLGSGDMAPGFGYAGFALKFAVNDKIDAAIIYDEPFGGSADYPVQPYFAQESNALVTSNALTTIGRYKFSDRFSAYAGFRAQTLDASVSIPFVGGYTAQSDSPLGFGFLAGVAYERPEIALRVALTYVSEISHDLTAVEQFGAGAAATTTLEVVTPQAVNLDFRTGINEKTLLFGGVRWANWGDFDITPVNYEAAVGRPILSYPDDYFTYSLGAARRITDSVALALSVTHEPSTGGLRTNLGPTDGFTSVGLGVNYQQNNMKIDVGVQHIWFGDADTLVGAGPGASFTDNTGLAFGLKVGFSF